MSYHKELIENANAPEITSFLKNEVGNGNMKNGLIKLLNDSDHLADVELSNSNKTKGLYALGTLVVLLASKLGYDEYKKKKQLKIEKENKKEIIEKVEELSEQEAEDIITEALEKEEEEQNNK